MSLRSRLTTRLAARVKNSRALRRVRDREAAEARRALAAWKKARDAARKTRKRLGALPTKAERAVAWAESQVGTVESPPYSNRGTKIDEWQRLATGTTGYAWCGAFVHAALRHAGVKGLSGSRMVYTPFILADAQAGRNGLAKLVSFDDIQTGDLVLMDFAPGGDPVMHVGIAVGEPRGGMVDTREGNTSFSEAGSQDNGGAVARRTRPRSVVVGGARPRW